MCYDAPPCKYFWFNPITGNDGCRLPKGKTCTALLYFCTVCGKLLPLDYEEKICEDCLLEQQEDT